MSTPDARASERLSDEKGRPLLAPALAAILRSLVDASRETLGHVVVDRVLIVAGAARRGARASIRPLTFGGHPPRTVSSGRRKPTVRIKRPHADALRRPHADALRRPHADTSELMLYEICLRPLFFRSTAPETRLEILAHELWHVSQSFDGTLDPERRHPVPDPEAAESFASEAASRAREAGAPLWALEYEGELRAPMWLDRPPSLIPADVETRLHYTEADLFLGVVEQLGSSREPTERTRRKIGSRSGR